MGNYINTGNDLLRQDRASRIFIDKSLMIQYTNEVLNTNAKYLCVSRPRRFGKSMAANMLAAYYDESCDSRELFHGLKIEKDPSFEKHLNKYLVIKIDLAWFITTLKDKKDIIGKLEKSILMELRLSYGDILHEDDQVLSLAIAKVYEKTGKQFVFIIDEYDALFREYPQGEEEQKAYLDFLRSLFKSSSTVSSAITLCYMTGILPIKRYNTQSALNNFREYTMVNPLRFAPFIGFTEDEVEALCREYGMDMEEMKRWYDGYSFPPNLSIYSPYSVVNAITERKVMNYWTETSSYDDAKNYINMNYDGLKEDVTKMIAGVHCPVKVGSFANDFVTLHNKDQVMTLLIHLGYLAYDGEEREAYIPNREVGERIAESIADSDWGYASKALDKSRLLLKATWAGDGEKVAGIVQSTHDELSSFLSYNRENDLALVIGLAYYAAREYYHVIREMTAGRGYADVAFVPRKGCDVMPMIIELKWGQGVDEAIRQVHEKKYFSYFSDSKEVLICGIGYDSDKKEHTCRIEKVAVNR